MVPVEGAVFAMGDESPTFEAAPVQTNVRVHGFAIDAYEVTVARFRAWMAAGQPIPSGPVVYRGGAMPFEGTVGPERALACDGDAANYRPARDRESHPINCVNWATAQAFCVWDGSGRGRLPTEAEWELAARGTTGRWYPWGSSAPDDTRVCWSPPGMQRHTSCVVGSFPAGDSPGGIHDLAGNVFEMVADWWGQYRNTPPGCWINSGPTDPICQLHPAMNGGHVARGGAWPDSGTGNLGSAARGEFQIEGRSSSVGFRCARDMP
jgi:formylglycine-generating enzyme required for sulfatase activity